MAMGSLITTAEEVNNVSEQMPKYTFLLEQARKSLGDIPRITGGDYYQHATRTLGTLNETVYSEIGIDETMLQAVLYHDIISLGWDHDLNPEVYNIIKSAETFEELAESWRNQVNVIVPVNHSTSTDITSAIRDSGSQITNEMYEFRAPMYSFPELLTILTENDLRGLILKSSEVIDNLIHPNTNRPSSAWRDAQELLSFFAPLLEIAGFDKLAQRAYDVSLRFLNKDNSNTHWASMQTAQDFELNHSIAIVADLYRRAERFVESDCVFHQKYLSQIPNTRLIERPTRTKTFGSMLQKYKEGGSIPDAIAYRLITQTESDIASTIIDVLNAIYTNNLELGHTVQNEKPIEVILKNQETIAKVGKALEDLFRNSEIDIEQIATFKTRPNGYQGVHINVNLGDDLGMEIQITAEKMYEHNEIGEACHVAYKARKYGLDIPDSIHMETKSAMEEIRKRKQELFGPLANAA